MAWFEINNYEIVAKDHLSGTQWGIYECWGKFIGGRWCLDYTWKLTFGISDKDWNTKCNELKTDKDFYEFCEWLGIYYKKDGHIYIKGKEVDQFGKPI